MSVHPLLVDDEGDAAAAAPEQMAGGGGEDSGKGNGIALTPSQSMCSVFVEHLDEHEMPSLAQLEAYNCLSPPLPTLTSPVQVPLSSSSSNGKKHPKRPLFNHASRRSSLPVPGPPAAGSSPSVTGLLVLKSPPTSPRLPLSESAGNIFFGNPLVRRISSSHRNGGGNAENAVAPSFEVLRDSDKGKRSEKETKRSNHVKAGKGREDLALEEYSLSPRLGREHPSPRPTRRYRLERARSSDSRAGGSYGGHGSSISHSFQPAARKGRETPSGSSSGFLAQDRSGSGFGSRSVVFSDEKLLEDARAVLGGAHLELKLKLEEYRDGAGGEASGRKSVEPELLSRRDEEEYIGMRRSFLRSNSPGHPGSRSIDPEDIASPVQERRRSFEAARALQEHLDRHTRNAPILLSSSASSRRSLDLAAVDHAPRNAFEGPEIPERRGSAPPAISSSRSLPLTSSTGFERAGEADSRKSILGHPPFPHQQVSARSSRLGAHKEDSRAVSEARPGFAKRSLSTGFLQLGKIVASLSASRKDADETGRRSKNKAEDKLTTPKFKVNAVRRLSSDASSDAHGPPAGGRLSPSPARNSFSGSSRPSSPLVTAHPVLAADSDIDEADTACQLSEPPSSTSVNALAAHKAAVSLEEHQATQALLKPTPHFVVESRRPALMRNAKSDDGVFGGASTAGTRLLRLPTAPSHNATMAGSIGQARAGHPPSPLSLPADLLDSHGQPSNSPNHSRLPHLKSPSARTSSPSPNLTKIPEATNDPEDEGGWTSSIRGKAGGRGRRTSAADLFAPPKPSSNEQPVAATDIKRVAEARGRVDSLAAMIKEEKEKEDGLDFSKKPVGANLYTSPLRNGRISSMSMDHLPLGCHSRAGGAPSPLSSEGEGPTPRTRTTSYSSLLTASRPGTPTTSPINSSRQPFPPGRPSSASLSTSPTTFMAQKMQQHRHRHTQSLPSGPAPPPGATLTMLGLKQIVSSDVSGKDTSVLEASHAKFAAVLTAAAVQAEAQAAAKHRSSRRSFLKDREAIRSRLAEADNENAIASSGGESDEDDQIPPRTKQQRMPKLSYGAESCTDHSDISNLSHPDLAARNGSFASSSEASTEPILPPQSCLKSESKDKVGKKVGFTSPARPAFGRTVSAAASPSRPFEAMSPAHSSHRSSSSKDLRAGIAPLDYPHALSSADRRQMNTSDGSTASGLSSSSSMADRSREREEEDVFLPKIAVW